MSGNMKDFNGYNFYIHSICNETGVETFNIL